MLISIMHDTYIHVDQIISDAIDVKVRVLSGLPMLFVN